jgi:hypothetical protein
MSFATLIECRELSDPGHEAHEGILGGVFSGDFADDAAIAHDEDS